jgi:hypothetical protein
VYLKVVVDVTVGFPTLTIPEDVIDATEGVVLVHVPPVFGEVVTVPPTQTEVVLTVDTGRGPTVIVKFVGEPVQPSKEGVTVTTELIEVGFPLSVKNEAMSPVPDVAVKPVAVFVFDQVYVAPGTFPVKVTASEFTPAHFN